MLNEVTLIGHLGGAPEIAAFNNGNKYAKFTIATSEHWTDKATGEKKERTEWHRITIFNEGLVGVAGKYLQKGSQVFIKGKLSTHKWKSQGGEDHYTTEIVLQGFDCKLQMLGKRGDRPPVANPDAYGQVNTVAGNTNGSGHNGSGAGASQNATAAAIVQGGYAASDAAQAPVNYENELDDEVPF